MIGFIPRASVVWTVLPDVTALGPYTYLATELFWGVIAVGLLVYADALWRATRTIAVLYPAGYVWDWYTLQAGVFEIPARTGYDLLGIPIEEHVFIVVVPATVVGAHECLRKLDREDVLPGFASARSDSGGSQPGDPR